MMKHIRLSGLIAVAVALACSSCQREAGPKAPRGERPDAVAVVGGTPISAAALQAELNRQFRSAGGVLSTDQKLAALDNLVRIEALYARAKADGFDQTPEMQARIKSLIIGHFKEQQLARATNAVTEREISLYYQTNGARYAQPAAVRGAVIFLPVPATAVAGQRAALRQEAETVWAEARQATDDQGFSQMVLRHSADQATRYRGGDLGWLTAMTEGVDPALFEALSALETHGQLAPLVSTPRGFYVARLVAKRAGSQRPLAEVKEAIRHLLVRERAAQAERDIYTSAKAGLGIQINRSRVESVSGGAASPEPPALPAGATAQVR